MDYRTYSQYADSFLNPNGNYEAPNFYAMPNFTQNVPPPNINHNNSDPRLHSNTYNTYSNYNAQMGYVTYDLSIPDVKNDIRTKSDDELWVETFLANIGKININLESTVEVKRDFNGGKFKRKPSICITTAKSTLRKCFELLNSIKSNKDYLEENVDTVSSVDWKKRTEEIGKMKEELIKLMSSFDSTTNLKDLQRIVAKRAKTRLRQKNKKLAWQVKKVEMENERVLEEKKIDDWLENMKDTIERCKMEETMKKDADCVLGEVTKKKSDARKHLSLLTSLIKLRNVREEVATQRGEKISLEDRSVFANTSVKLLTMWQNALGSYNKEEQGLRMMLEQNAAEDDQQNRIAKEKKVMQEWELVFFGPKTIPSPAYWGLTSAERDIETFIAIRKSWDFFLARNKEDTMASNIPIGWVLPTADANENWTKYLNNS